MCVCVQIKDLGMHRKGYHYVLAAIVCMLGVHVQQADIITRNVKAHSWYCAYPRDTARNRTVPHNLAYIRAYPQSVCKCADLIRVKYTHY